MTTPKKILMSLAAVSLAGGLAVAEDKAKPVTMAADEMKWTEIPQSGGVTMSPLWGDAMKGGPHGEMVKFPPDNKHPLHTHTNEIKLVVVSGTFLLAAEGGPEKKYGAGSYAMVPGGWKHTSGCAAGAPCVMFQEMTDKFDMTPVAAPAAKGGGKKK